MILSDILVHISNKSLEEVSQSFAKYDILNKTLKEQSIIMSNLKDKFNFKELLEASFYNETLFLYIYSLEANYIIEFNSQPLYIFNFLKSFHKNKHILKDYSLKLNYKIFQSTQNKNINNFQDMINCFISSHSWNIEELNTVSNFVSTTTFIYDSLFSNIPRDILVNFFMRKGIPEQFENPNYYFSLIRTLNIQSYFIDYDSKYVNHFIENFCNIINEFSYNNDFNIDLHLDFIYNIISFNNFKMNIILLSNPVHIKKISDYHVLVLNLKQF